MLDSPALRAGNWSQLCVTCKVPPRSSPYSCARLPAYWQRCKLPDSSTSWSAYIVVPKTTCHSKVKISVVRQEWPVWPGFAQSEAMHVRMEYQLWPGADRAAAAREALRGDGALRGHVRPLLPLGRQLHRRGQPPLVCGLPLDRAGSHLHCRWAAYTLYFWDGHESSLRVQLE